ncbi:His Kinase A (phospho-acceptor) domain-containing protein [Enhydrobacter aerosaccus]|uniref:histidine kinase n=1 Tax=Enhydrobacter aerosaccus TaxID=225324 RepID=A0A1T4LWU6_9HYPH|nr:HAMP domain-containing sensor histidine kinase [Enhydrobacter aerosaccus]SJZ58958.1 His Kinase A (phospho-acceptor) domain-containing protein [Enhydrobacter aerosaccus]
MRDGTLTNLAPQWEREATLRVMTAYVAHELNHPLGTIINLANTLSRQLAKPVIKPQDIDEQIKEIKAEAMRATTIIKHLRMLTERRPVGRSVVDLVEVCQEAIDRLASLAENKMIRVRLHTCTPRTKVHGFKALLETALLNFMMNSIAALDVPMIATRRLTIRVASPNPETTVVQIFDNGCGVPEHIRDRMFEPFVTTKPEGSGLGLAIASDIIHWHRGSVSCRSRRWGTCMEMLLPCA